MIVYEGPSRLDGAPIVAILTLKSSNSKTGNMAQLWILRADQHPVDAVESGDDAAICGSCVHRKDASGSRSCYVALVRGGPATIYKAYKRGSYPVADNASIKKALKGRKLRLGAYGDPAAVPSNILEQLTDACDDWTGYTHQWRTHPDALRFCMASVDNPVDWFDLQEVKAGARYFRTKPKGRRNVHGEIPCPASKEARRRTTCERCMLCNPRKQAKSITIEMH